MSDPAAPHLADRRIADAPPDNWVDARSPAFARPYLRLIRADRPIGVWLLLVPCWQGQALAAAADGRALPNLWHALLFAIGAYVMRGAGCAWNDIVDKDIDAKVARTAARPIPAGDITRKQAFAFLVALCLVGLLVLLQLGPVAIWTGLASLGLVAAYPFMKRITWWPQAWLGLTFNWGMLVGFAADAGRLGWAPFAAYAGSIFWTIAYDTIYAHQDKEDDALIGVKSAALRLGAATKTWLPAFWGLHLAGIIAAALIAGLGWFALLAIIPVAAHYAWQYRALDIDDGAVCLKLFRANRNAALLLLAGILGAAAFRALAG